MGKEIGSVGFGGGRGKRKLTALVTVGVLVGGGFGIAKSCESDSEKPISKPIEQTTASTSPTPEQTLAFSPQQPPRTETPTPPAPTTPAPHPTTEQPKPAPKPTEQPAPPAPAPRPPATPTSLVVEPIPNGHRLTFTDNANNETGFIIDNGDGDRSLDQASVGNGETVIFDWTDPKNDWNCFKVAAKNDAGQSDWTAGEQGTHWTCGYRG